MNEKRLIKNHNKKVVTKSGVNRGSQVVTPRRGKAGHKPGITGHLFIREVRVKGYWYQQVCRHYYDENGKRRMEIAKLVWPERKVEAGASAPACYKD